MQLKNAFHLQTTATSSLPPIPAHNNNQPFTNVNLAVNEVEVSGEEVDVATGNDTVTVYSLYDDEAEVHSGGSGGGVDSELPRPSENLRFLTNDYGFLELIQDDTTDSDTDDSPNSSSCSTYSDDDDDPNHQITTEPVPPPITVSCDTCGCYGLLHEFYDAKHCTHDCSIATRINECKLKNELEEKVRKEEEEKKEQEHEIECKRIKLEVENVDEVVEIQDNPFRINDVLEAIDPQHQSLFCPVVVVEVIGYRLLLKFVGYPDKFNFWVNADSEYIFPVGWSKTYTLSNPNNTVLHFHSPPNFTYEEYLNTTENARAAPDSNFPNIEKILSCPPSLIRVGMKVEAVDRRNKNLICVASVSCVMGERFLVHFDSWDSLYDYWSFLGSGDVHPVGYCKDHGIDITPPHCYENASEFDWDEYLKKTNSEALPSRLLEIKREMPFGVGEMVEVIDKRSPRLLRLARITAITPSTCTYTITFPSTKSSSFDYDIHAYSEYIHPLGWGQRTGHPLADDDFDPNDEVNTRSPSPDSNFPVCPNHITCKSVCNVRGPNFPFHSKTRDCPYSIANVAEYSDSGKFTDRVVVFEDSHYDLGGKKKEENEEVVTPPVKEEDTPNDKEQISVKTEPKVFPTVFPHKPQAQALLSRNSNPINFNKLVSTQVKCSAQVSQPIPKRSEILTWSHERISGLVQSLCSNLPTAQKVADQFRCNLIDGESFLMLTQSDMTDALGIKLGPAVKIYNLIRLIDLNK